MNTKQTSGPWSYFLDGDKFVISNEDNEYIAETYSLRSDDGSYSEEANAKLISKACLIPELEKVLLKADRVLAQYITSAGIKADIQDLEIRNEIQDLLNKLKA